MDGDGAANARGDFRDGMAIDWDVPIEMDDGVVLRADVFRPAAAGRYPVIMSYGPYAKGLSFQEGYPSAWQQMVAEFPEVERDSTGRYQNWEVVDPERWVPDGYVCVRVDGRGAGRSPGVLDPWSPRETRDFCACIEWAADQAWSSGKVGLNGISYYGMNQWHAASRKPRGLAAICVWEGAADFYRDATRHGGIYCTFLPNWYGKQVTTVQHGLGERGPRHPVTRELACGPQTLSDEALAAQRSDFAQATFEQRHWHAFFDARSAQWEHIDLPLLSAGNWGGAGLHLRGNVEAFVQSPSRHKWLEMHGRAHWTEFYTDYGVALQKRFFGHYLKGEDNGWERSAPVKLQVRHPDRFVARDEQEWPLARTQWTKYFLQPQQLSLGTDAPTAEQALSYAGLGDGVTFMLPPAETPLEITGPLAARLYISSQTADADLFLVLRLFSGDLREVTFQGALDPHAPVAQGWLRASHRKTDPARSLPWRPWHTHDQSQPLVPGEIYPLDIEIWPTSIVVPPGYRLALTVRGKDYEHGLPPGELSNIRNPMRGSGPFLHDDPCDRPPEIFGGRVTLHMGPGHPSHLLLPVIPAQA